MTGAMLCSIALAVLMGTEPGQNTDWPEPDQRVTCGPLTLDVYISRTAHLFHVVDQLPCGVGSVQVDPIGEVGLSRNTVLLRPAPAQPTPDLILGR